MALAKLGPQVEIVRADLDDKPSLVSAFRGADVVYLVTDYWNIQSNPEISNLNTEIMNGITAIEAAAETQSLKHFIFGTLPHISARLADMPWKNIYHFHKLSDRKFCYRLPPLNFYSCNRYKGCLEQLHNG